MRGSEVESECSEKQQILQDDEDGWDGFLEPFRNELRIWDLEVFLGFSGQSCNRAGEIERPITWIDRVAALVIDVVRCFTEREARGCPKQNVYDNIH